MNDKQYSINDFKIGDIYEHWGGGFYEVTLINLQEKKLSGKRVNDLNAPNIPHGINDVRVAYFADV